jgi:hypothetical protein
MRLTPTSTNSRMLMVLSLLLIFWGCTKKEETKPANSTNQTAQSAESTPAKISGAAPAGVPPGASSAAIIATADGEKSGTRVEVTELKRASDNTVTLKFAMVNDGSDRHSISYDYGDGQQGATDYATIGGVTLVDGANKKKYFVVRDSENNCLCSRGLKDIPASSRANLWAKFPAPPDDVQKISIVIPHFGPIDDVPISR